MVKLAVKYALVAMLLIAIMLTIDIWQLDRLEKAVRNTAETAEQAAIITGMQESGMMFVNKSEIDFDVKDAEEAFYTEIKRGLNLDNNLKPKSRWLQEVKIEYVKIGMYNGKPIVTAGIEAKVKLMVAPLIGYKTNTVKVQLADRHVVVWK